jgi:hypothetical protein
MPPPASALALTLCRQEKEKRPDHLVTALHLE